MSSLTEEERAVKQQRQREQTRLRVQALRRKRHQIVALQSSVEPDAVDAEDSDREPALHVQVPKLFIESPVNQGYKIITL